MAYMNYVDPDLQCKRKASKNHRSPTYVVTIAELNISSNRYPLSQSGGHVWAQCIHFFSSRCSKDFPQIVATYERDTIFNHSTKVVCCKSVKCPGCGYKLRKSIFGAYAMVQIRSFESHSYLPGPAADELWRQCEIKIWYLTGSQHFDNSEKPRQQRSCGKWFSDPREWPHPCMVLSISSFNYVADIHMDH